jgi:hypothetical protein
MFCAQFSVRLWKKESRYEIPFIATAAKYDTTYRVFLYSETRDERFDAGRPCAASIMNTSLAPH